MVVRTNTGSLRRINDTGSGSDNDDDDDRVKRTSRKQISELHSALLVNARKTYDLQWIELALENKLGKQPQALAERVKFESEYTDKLRGGNRHDTIVHTLVKCTVDRNWKTMDRFRPLLRLILQMDPEILGVRNEDGQLAFTEAVYQRKINLVEVKRLFLSVDMPFPEACSLCPTD